VSKILEMQYLTWFSFGYFSGSLIVALIFFFLYLNDRLRYLRLWAGAWGLLALASFTLIVFGLSNETLWLYLFSLSLIVGGLLYNYASYEFSLQRKSRLNIYLCLIVIALIVASLFTGNLVSISAPAVYIFSGYLFIDAGRVFFYYRRYLNVFTGIVTALLGVFNLLFPLAIDYGLLFPWAGFLFGLTVFTMAATVLIMHSLRLREHFERLSTELQNKETQLKNILEMHREREAQLQAVLQSTADGILAADNNDNILAYNVQFKNMWNIPPDFLEKKDADLIQYVKEQLLNPEAFMEKIHNLKHSEKEEFDTLHFKDRRIYERYTAPLIRDGEAWGRVWSFRDITHRKIIEDTLRESQEMYKEIITSIEEGYYETDLKGKITYCNDSAAKILGYYREEFLGMNYAQIASDPQRVYNTFYQIYRSGRPRQDVVLEMVRRDGDIVYVELSVSLIRDKDESVTGFRGVSRDITERKRMEEHLHYLSMHDQLTGIYNRAYFEEELNRPRSDSEYPMSIISIDLDGLKLVNDTVGHNKGDELLTLSAEILEEVVGGQGILCRVGGDEFVALLPSTTSEEGEKIIERVLSKVNEYNNTLDDRIPLSLSMGLAVAEDKNESLEEVFKEADELMYRDKLHKGTNARYQIVNALMATLSERDFITEGHAVRMEELCRKIGEKINLLPKQISNLCLLAQIHDLGKVGIPDYILFKKGPLTQEEWETMRLHVDKGYRIALSSADLSGIADLILKHHEAWDGGGYPLGVSGEEIPVECRILSIVDAYDAMTSDRPYRKAMSKEKAIQEIKRCSGKQFDPHLVEVFLSIVEEGEKGNSYSDIG